MNSYINNLQLLLACLCCMIFSYMSRYSYNGNGRESNRERGLELFPFDESLPQPSGQLLEVDGDLASGYAAKIDRVYTTLAGAIMGRMRVDQLEKRTLASGLIVYTTHRNARLEPGIETTMMPDTTVAHNFNDL